MLTFENGSPADLKDFDVEALLVNPAPYKWSTISASLTGEIALAKTPALLRCTFETKVSAPINLVYNHDRDVAIWIDSVRVPDENLYATHGELALSLERGEHNAVFHVGDGNRPFRADVRDNSKRR